MTDDELRAYIGKRREAVEAKRRDAAQQPAEWAADGAVHELDRLAAWLNLRRGLAEVEAEH